MELTTNNSTIPFSNTNAISFIDGEPPIAPPITHVPVREPKLPLKRSYTRIYENLVSNLDVWAKVNTLDSDIIGETQWHAMSVRFPIEIIDKLNRLIDQIEAQTGRRLSRNKVLQNLIDDAIESSDYPVTHQPSEISSTVEASVITRKQKENLISSLRTRCYKDGFKLNHSSVFNDNTKGYDIWLKLSRS